MDEVRDMARDAYNEGMQQAEWAYGTGEDAYHQTQDDARAVYETTIGLAHQTYDAGAALVEEALGVIDGLLGGSSCPLSLNCCLPVALGAAESDVGEWSDSDPRDGDFGFVTSTGAYGTQDKPYKIGIWISANGDCGANQMPPGPL